ncbi:hypothetical protein [Aquisphaera giovannonii]|uniref:hypothetical protein n=1 Tax=Aquisphaera giovannonii TaxID=406548 RepID=UPI001FE3ABC7|nr:hypothetical protein [Aquisphaera giovannonii]
MRILDRAIDDAREFLSADQYAHLALQFKEMAREEEPTRCETVDIRPIEDYHELRDKGGILGRINVRVFFFVQHPARSIVVLGAVKKENEGQTPTAVKVLMRYRMRSYLATFDRAPDPSGGGS